MQEFDDLVPPRRGQRAKTEVLKPFNNGKPFRIFELTSKGVTYYGIKDERSCESLWVGMSLQTTTFRHFDTSNEVFLEMPCKKAYVASVATIGGVGKHTRWKTVLPQTGRKASPDLLVTEINDVDALKKLMVKLKPFAFLEEVDYSDEEECLAHIKVSDSKYIGNVAAAFHAAGYGAVPIDERFEETCGKLGIERKDRSDHMWWNQSKSLAGPLRDTHRWDYGFIPQGWSRLPFTWTAMADNVSIPKENLKDLPLPFRNYVIESKVGRWISELDMLKCEVDVVYRDEHKEMQTLIENYEHSISEWQSLLTMKHCVTCRLTVPQNDQLLAATYWRTIAPFDEDVLHVAELIAFRYLIHGFEGREVGPYRQSANYLGHGAKIRTFKHHMQYRPENIPTAVLNKVYRNNGQLRGTGFKGTRGKYGHKQFPKYNPKNRSSRSATVEEKIREKKNNCFKEYEDDKVLIC